MKQSYLKPWIPTHSETATLFIDYINALCDKECSCCVFDVLFKTRLVEESKKYGMQEKAPDLTFNAAMRLIMEHKGGFSKKLLEKYTKKDFSYNDPPVPSIPLEHDWTKTGRELAKQAEHSRIIKLLIERILYHDKWKLLQDLEIGEAKFVNKHPLWVFNYLLDLIKEQRTPIYSQLRDFRMLILHRVRMGNAVLKRYEWSDESLFLKERNARSQPVLFPVNTH